MENISISYQRSVVTCSCAILHSFQDAAENYDSFVQRIELICGSQFELTASICAGGL